MGEFVTPGDLLAGRYRVERILGKGGMGLVVAARHIELHGLYAIKLLQPDAVGGQKALDRFLREARAASMLRSEHICRVHDFGRLDSGGFFMVMEHLEGSDFARVLSDYGPLPVHEAVLYLLQACEGLAEAHGCDIVHRDLKPANLFLTRANDGSPCVKVLDFGIAKALHVDTASALTASGAILGTPRYMSPEQIRLQEPLDGRSDIWSLGVTLYELVTGTTPFDGDGIHVLLAKILGEPPLPPSQVAAGLPPELDVVILRCLAKNWVNRFQNVNELALALLPFAPPEAARLAQRVGRVLASAGGRRSVLGPAGDFDFGEMNATTMEGAEVPSPSVEGSASRDTGTESSKDESMTQDGPRPERQTDEASSGATAENDSPAIEAGAIPPASADAAAPLRAHADDRQGAEPSAPGAEARTTEAPPARGWRRPRVLRTAYAVVALVAFAVVASIAARRNSDTGEVSVARHFPNLELLLLEQKRSREAQWRTQERFNRTDQGFEELCPHISQARLLQIKHGNNSLLEVVVSNETDKRSSITTLTITAWHQISGKCPELPAPAAPMAPRASEPGFPVQKLTIDWRAAWKARVKKVDLPPSAWTQLHGEEVKAHVQYKVNCQHSQLIIEMPVYHEIDPKTTHIIAVKINELGVLTQRLHGFAMNNHGGQTPADLRDWQFVGVKLGPLITGGFDGRFTNGLDGRPNCAWAHVESR